MQKMKEGLCCTPEDTKQFLCALASEPGMFDEYNLDREGRLVDVYWASANQQENCTRYGNCIQLETTVFACRSARIPKSDVAMGLRQNQSDIGTVGNPLPHPKHESLNR